MKKEKANFGFQILTADKNPEIQLEIIKGLEKTLIEIESKGYKSKGFKTLEIIK